MPELSHTDSDNPRDAAMGHGFMAVGWAVAFGFIASYLPWPWTVDINSPDFNPMIALPIIMAGLSALETFRTVRAVQRHRRFGAATLELADARPQLGGRLKGVVRTAHPLNPTANYRVRVLCVDVHEFRNTTEGSNSPYRNSDFVVWKHELEVLPAVDSTRGIPFELRLPDSVGPAPQPPIRQSQYFTFKAAIMIPGLRRVWAVNDPPVARRWLIEVSAPMPGTDFLARFPLPIDTD